MTNIKKYHLVFAVLAALAAGRLIYTASDPYKFSAWQFGDAQTMLSLNQWEKRGWAENYLLFAPQGYAGLMETLDKPPLSRHAHGLSPKVSPSVGPRVLYTHYPSGYLLPYAVLHNLLGVKNIVWLRMFSILLSLGALVFFYLAVKELFGIETALLAAAFYSLAPPFLNYGWSLANQPVDDFLRCGFMLLTAKYFSSEKRGLLIAAWCAEFALSLCSLDSVLFVYVWLTGLCRVKTGKFNFKLILAFAAAPIAAHTLQLIQNIWYLGPDLAAQDIVEAFLTRSLSGKAFGTKLSALLSPYIKTFGSWIVLLECLIAIFIAQTAKKPQFKNSLMLLALLFACGAVFALVLPSGASLSYQTRQMLPFIAVFAAVFTLFTLSELRQGRTMLSIGAALMAALMWSWLAKLSFAALHPRSYKDDVDVLLARQIAQTGGEHESVIFNLDGFLQYWEKNYVPGYPQVHPITEYFAGNKLILSFKTPQALAQDMLLIKSGCNCEFLPIAVTDRKERVYEICRYLDGCRQDSINPRQIEGRWTVDFTGALFNKPTGTR